VHEGGFAAPVVDAGTTLATRDARLDAVTTWGIPDAGELAWLAAAISQPVLVATGDNDRLVPTPNSYLLADRLPGAELRIYPDAGHGFLFQYPVELADYVVAFLDQPRPGGRAAAQGRRNRRRS
jgi:pimeloyl-ACP methyl ester carboxylesterase